MTIANKARRVLDLLEGFPPVLRKEFEESRPLVAPLHREKFRTITIAADGQTLLAAKLFEAFAARCLTVPVVVSNEFVFPSHAYRPASLLIVTSLDKITADIGEEIQELLQKGSKIICLAPQVDIPYTTKSQICIHACPSNLFTFFPEYLFFLLTAILSSIGVLSFEQGELDETIQLLGTLRDKYARSIPLAMNAAKDMASVLCKKVLFIYGTGAITREMAQVWAVRIRHFSQQLADWGSLTEESGTTPLLENTLRDVPRGVVLLRNRSEPSYIEERIQDLRRIYESNAIEVREAYTQGFSSLARTASLLYLGSFVSVYLALVAEFSAG